MSRIFLEGGGDAKDLQVRCREGFRRILEKCGYEGRMPRLVASGGRKTVFDDFERAHNESNSSEFIAMLVDSEDPVVNIERTWEHLRKRDHVSKPQNASNEQVLFMTTCMETWIVCDRSALQRHYGSQLQAIALPPLTDLEKRSRRSIQEKLVHATRNCSNAYAKGERSYQLLGVLDPAALQQRLPSFKRACRILDARL